MAQRFRIDIEYDGRPYVGWQAQANGPSVQAAIERAVKDFSGEEVTVFGAGRTDAGVHARGQVAHFDLERKITPFRLAAAINAHLKDEAIAIMSAEEVGEDFHARFSATRRHYRYRIVNRRAPLTFDRGLAWRIGPTLDADAMHAAAQYLVGKHDFTTFRAAECQAKSPVKTLDRLDVRRNGDEIFIAALARSFLHHQVRSMVGTLKLVGEGKWAESDVKDALEACDRAALGFNAPPDGLMLMRVDYAETPSAPADEKPKSRRPASV